MDELKRRERWTELAASIAEADRHKERNAGWRDSLRFWFNPYQVADEPVDVVPTPGLAAPPPLPGVGSTTTGKDQP